MSDKKVTVIIPTFDRCDYLVSAIDSALNQTINNIDILVIDDNIDPQKNNEAKKICSEKKVKYIKNYRSKGGCGARNSGALIAETEFIAFLDDDDYWLPEKLEKQLALISKHPYAAGTYCSHYKLIEEQQILAPSKLDTTEINHEQLIKGKCPASTSLILIKRKALIEAGLFDETLPSFQDYDMWLRATMYGPLLPLSERLTVIRHHVRERVSINIHKRMTGLSLISRKLSLNDKSTTEFNKTKNLFKSYAYTENAKISKKYFKTLYYQIKSIISSPNRISNWALMLIFIFGNSTYWKIYKLKTPRIPYSQ